MKIKTKNSLLVFGALLCGTLFLTAAASCTYQEKYTLTDCSLNSRNLFYELPSIDCAKKYADNGYTAYFDADARDGKINDEWIDRFDMFSALLQDKNIDASATYFLSDEVVVRSCTPEAGGTALCFPTNLSKEEALAWILHAKLAEKVQALPYGLYAGIAAYWLNEREETAAYSTLPFSAVEGGGYLTELQFPLYERGGDKKERAFAWNFSYTIVRNWVAEGNSIENLAALTKAELDAYLQTKYRISLPLYEFSPYSPGFEYQVRQGCFTYYIDREFTDLILPESCFSTSYASLSDWLKDNWKMKEASDAVFGITSMYDIEIFLSDGKASTDIAGEAYLNRIDIYSAGIFSHEYIHHILFQREIFGFLYEVFPDMQANDSKYANLMWYYLFSGKSSYPYDKASKEKDTYGDAMKLYNKVSVLPASLQNFDFWLFADCFSAVHTKPKTQFINRLQPDSLHYYIARNYGEEYVYQLHFDPETLIAGKTYTEITYEWLAYLAQLQNL